MLRKVLSAALVSAAMVVAGPALAGPGGGGGGGGHGGGGGAAGEHAGMGGGMSGGMGGVMDRGGMNTRSGTDIDVETNTDATRINSHATTRANGNASFNRSTTTNPATGVSQGPLHASPTGIAHANQHSVLAGGAVSGTTLTGLTTGLTVMNANGTNIGTVSRIVTDASGNIRLVLVTNTTTGQTFRLSPTTLTINGTTVTTTSTLGG